jgi:hypothetical protein
VLQLLNAQGYILTPIQRNPWRPSSFVSFVYFLQ